MNKPSAPTRERRRPYWQAQGLADEARTRFAAASREGDESGMQDAFFMVTRYYARTLIILPQALEERREELARAALRNLLVLDAALGHMHRAEPQVVPLAMPVGELFHERYELGLVVRVFEDFPGVLSVGEVVERLEAFKLLGEVTAEEVEVLLDKLLKGGMLLREDEGWRRSKDLYLDLSMTQAILHTLLGPDLAAQLKEHGFERLHQVVERRMEFAAAFVAASGLSEGVAALFIDVAEALQNVHRLTHTPWHYRDLIHSATPRPYQLEAYAVFKGLGYHNLVIEAPTGSGKTLVGLMCIQDWLQSLVPGQSVLVLVPTNNYQQQWVRELCYNPIGLDLTPEVVFAGTPTDLARFRRRSGEVPVVMVLTYAALAQMSRDAGVFDAGAIRRFLAANGVRDVILDEAHKVVEDLDSTTSQVVRALAQEVDDNALGGMIGFTGTAESYRAGFAELGMRLVHVIPMLELIASGFVAPFAEFGIPFAYSERERQVRQLLEEYKALLRRFIDLAGSAALRSAFAAVPLERRAEIGLQLLGMYEGRSDADVAIKKRLTQWEQGGEISLSEAPLLSILQVATQREDKALLPESARAEYAEIVEKVKEISAELEQHLFLPETVALLQAPGPGARTDWKALAALLGEENRSERRRSVELLLCPTLVGLYDGLKNWYQYMGEGRVAAVRAVIDAERRVREVSGTIVFDKGRRIRWERGKVTPGFDGVAGLFSELLGDDELRPMAALSSEIYMPWDADKSLPNHVADHIEQRLMMGEIGRAMHDLLAADLGMNELATRRFGEHYDELLAAYAAKLAAGEKANFATFLGQVLRPLRLAFGHQRSGIDVAAAARLRARLGRRNLNLRALLGTFFDYAGLARRWRQPHEGLLVQASGREQRFFVVQMPGGRRKQLMYDLVARIVDDESLPINMIIVSNWARTGWNVISPNLLIDATATRDVTAWQQLRGRAMRALRSWSNDCYRAQRALLGINALGRRKPEDEWPEDVKAALEGLLRSGRDEIALRGRPEQLLRSVLNAERRSRYAADGVEAFSADERLDIAVRLMLHYNKVTHIHELVRASGSDMQVRYERDEKRWLRRDDIAEKHAYEESVDLESGRVVRGAEHAPLIYAEDPRSDAPEALCDAVAARLKNSEGHIVRAWIRAAMGNI